MLKTVIKPVFGSRVLFHVSEKNANKVAEISPWCPCPTLHSENLNLPTGDVSKQKTKTKIRL